MWTARAAAALLFTLTWVYPADAQGPAPARFQLAASTLQLAPGATDATLTVTVIARLQKEDLRPGSEAVLADHTPSATGVIVKTEPVKTTPDLQQEWRFPVTVQRFPASDSQARVFVLTYGTFREPLTYTLANTSKTFAWSVKAPTDWNLASMTALPVAINVGDVSATGIRLYYAALAGEDKLKRTLGTHHFELCEAAADTCTTPASIQPRQPRSLFLRPTAPLPVGVFRGNVYVTAAEKTEPEALAVTIYSPHPRGVLYGFLALGLGVLASLIVQVFARTWIQSRHDKAAVATLRSRHQQLVAAFKALPESIQRAAEEWEKKAVKLSTEMVELDRLVRSPIPLPFADEVLTVETLKAGLERFGKTVLHLRALLDDGLTSVAGIVAQIPTATAPAETAAAAIAGISPAEDVATRINVALATLRQAAQAPAPARLAGAGGQGARLQSLRLQIAGASLLVWLFWAAVSILTGGLALIYQNPAFGSGVDLLTCLAWGLGVSVMGQQLSQATPATVAQSVGVRLPGAN